MVKGRRTFRGFGISAAGAARAARVTDGDGQNGLVGVAAVRSAAREVSELGPYRKSRFKSMRALDSWGASWVGFSTYLGSRPFGGGERAPRGADPSAERIGAARRRRAAAASLTTSPTGSRDGRRAMACPGLSEVLVTVCLVDRKGRRLGVRVFGNVPDEGRRLCVTR